MTFEEWKATGRDIADLRDHPDETQFYRDDYDYVIPGRLYEPGWIVKQDDGRWWLCIYNWDDSFADLAEAEQILWDQYAGIEG